MCFISLLIISLLLNSCGNEELEAVKIIVPNGTPYLAVAGLLNDDRVIIDAVSGTDGLDAALVSGSHDIVIAPINLGVNRYNSGNSKYRVSHILTINNAYIVTKSENKLDSIVDLTGKSVLGFGAKGIPGNLLKKVYSQNMLDVSNIDFKYSSSANVYSDFSGLKTSSDYALMSEPEISKLIVNDKLDIKTLDLSSMVDFDVVQACVFINPDTSKSRLDNVLASIKENVLKLNNDPTNYIDKILPLDRVFSLTGREVLIHSIPKTNIVFKEAKANKGDIENILSMLGVTLPNEEFYC